MGESRSNRDGGRVGNRATLVLPEWLEAGLLGGLVVAAVFFARDSWLGEPIHTASVLGTLLLEGPAAARETTSAPAAAALYNAVHFALWIALGLLAAQTMRRAEDDASLRWLPIVLALLTLLALGGLDGLVRETRLTRTHLWFGGTAGLIAMGGFLWWRHPGAFRR